MRIGILCIIKNACPACQPHAMYDCCNSFRNDSVHQFYACMGLTMLGKDAMTPLTHHHAFPSAFSALAPSLPLGSTQKPSARPATALSSAGTKLRCRAAARLGGESVSGRARRIATALQQTQPDREGAELKPEAVVTSSQPISFDSQGKKSLSLSLCILMYTLIYI